MRLPDLKLETILKHIREHGFESLDPAVQVQANKVLQDHVARERFETVAADPRSWKRSGDRLLGAANLIRTTHLTNWRISSDDILYGTFDAAEQRLKFDMHGVYLLLAGLSIENYAKGAIIIAAAKDHVKDGKLKDLNSHDCLELTKRAGVTLAASEETTLRCLTVHIQWRGRYPTRNDFDEFKELPAMPIGSRIPEDYTNVDEIVQKLLAILNG
ncbi:MAG: hypothetical protein QM770_08825 [Tepidisphaeraceae bacterium]